MEARNMLVGGADGGKAVPTCGQELYMGNLHLLFNFAVILKLYIYKTGLVIQLHFIIFLLRDSPPTQEYFSDRYTPPSTAAHLC